MRYKIQVTVISLCTAFAFTACGKREAKPASENLQTPHLDTQVFAQVNIQSQTPEAASKAAVKSITKIVFLGDSLTAGYGLPREQAWPEQVQLRLKSAGYNTAIINAGVSGDNTANGLARYDWSVGETGADVLVLALGANDFLQGVPPATTRKNLKAIIEQAQADNLKVILAGVATPQLERLGPIGKSYATIYPELAKTYDLSFFPSILSGVSNRPELLQSDGLHPTKAGVEIMADRFTQYLRKDLDN